MALNKVNFVTDHLEMEWLGLANFTKAMYEDAEIPNKLMQTFQQSLLIVPLIVVFALIMALLLNSKFPGRAFFRAVFFLPVMLTSGNLITTLTGQGQGTISFLQSGTAAQLVAGIGGSLGTTLQTVLDNFLVILWYSGVQMLLLIAGMQSINPSTYEAAKIDGAGTWEVLWTITLPGLMPFLFICVIYTIVDQFTASFNPILEVITHHSTNISTGYGYASAIAWLYFLVILAILALVILMFRKSLGLTVQRKEKKA
jgi:ABC-type sugar transport system permease subunit